MSIERLYTAKAKTSGGRDGRAISSDNVIDLPLSTPKEMGGPGKANTTNPEQLFAAGYSACFDGALNLVARLHQLRRPSCSEFIRHDGLFCFR